jgi:RNA polymerase sigma factor (sigma-70 family)
MTSPAERERFGREFETAGPALLAWARLRVRAELRAGFDPEDLVQEVGCRALAAAASFDPQRATFRQWLFGIANRVLLEALRDLGRARTGTPPGLGPSAATDAVAAITSITARVARDDLVQVFLQRIDALDNEDRALLVHRGLEGLGHPQVAALLGLTEDTTRKRWQRLCDRMRNDPVFASLADE